ncbi:hypothetical protein N9L47_01790 [Rhodobacteraceae bacterium]|nr:hypothetical protein [Paracoccaceae bacterium]
MTEFTLGLADVRSATRWGASRVRTITTRLYPLEFRLRPAGPAGGGRVRLFRLSDLLTRCRESRGFTDEMALKLIAADAATRSKEIEE